MQSWLVVAGDASKAIVSNHMRRIVFRCKIEFHNRKKNEFMKTANITLDAMHYSSVYFPFNFLKIGREEKTD